MKVIPSPLWKDTGTHKETIDAEPIKVTELLLIPKASSTGAEGTMFYDFDDDHVYVGTE